ncbi:MAG: acylphosphatase [Chlorobi bacterium]|nr:MAG: acylphosphatase [Bacteroidota bacterium]KXK35745.1 MAG: acylphosphatase [Chlorobi bacterium OLB6]MBE2265293.1 acylphosphatase [Flavobacteriales bacterium]MBL1160244.1 acylphosphatase [Chlorobiota bacterium]MBW7853382.1 acylphosphatase [Candidatus Kapabacteria bacterium]MCC6330429.1 acylphosphatase [Ignavibacteria bacterium]
MASVHYLISGKVQGVGYRRFALYHANRLDLTGFITNLEDKTVECIAQGSTGNLSEFEMLLRQGPAHSRVESVQCTDLETEPRVYSGFRIL